MVNAQFLRDALRCVSGCKQCNRPNGRRHCPAHDDQHASLSIDERNSKLLVHCHAGCEQSDLIEALRRKSLWPEKRGGGGTINLSRDRAIAQSIQSRSNGLTLAQYAAAKKLPVDFLVGLGLTDLHLGGTPAVRFPYFLEDGAEGAVRFRLALNGDCRFRWRSGTKPMLYGLSRLPAAWAVGYIVLAEGESDPQTLWFHDIPAIGIPGVANWNEERDAPHLDGIDRIYVQFEPDQGGEALRRRLERSRIKERVWLVTLEGFKDPSEMYLADPQGFRERWQGATDAAVPWISIEREAGRQRYAEAWQRCAVLAQSPRILDCFVEDLGRTGIVGESRAAQLLFLILLSRLLSRIVSAVLKAQSSVGKSFVAQGVLRFFPSSAFYELSAMSEHALAYSTEPLAHRMLVLYEAAGVNSDFASYLLRSLLSEGRVRYETVDKTTEGLVPRLIEREGPTGLIITTTALKLHPENETRLLTVPMTDTAEQTKAILRMQAMEAEGHAVDFVTWHALQVWLEGGPRQVTIPFAQMLADLIPPVAVRLRRDFPAVLSLIRAHALLHQVNRDRDRLGRVVATVQDYATVRTLVAEIVSEGVSAAVPPLVRETVETVRALFATGKSEVGVVDIARRLDTDPTTAYRRAVAAVDRNYLRNLETRWRRPARLVLGEELPGDQDVLPPPDLLVDSTDCTIASSSRG